MNRLLVLLGTALMTVGVLGGAFCMVFWVSGLREPRHDSTVAAWLVISAMCAGSIVASLALRVLYKRSLRNDPRS